MASVPLVPAKAREGAGAWLLLRCCTVAVIVPLVPAKARKGAGAWLLLRRCTVAAVVPLVQPKLEKGRGAGCCCGDSAVPSPPL